MSWVLLVGLALALCWLWDIRRVLGLRARPSLPVSDPKPALVRADFQGAMRPNRFIVVRWPDGSLYYQGSLGAAARDVYTNNHPRPGESLELWEHGHRRAIKEG